MMYRDQLCWLIVPLAASNVLHHQMLFLNSPTQPKRAFGKRNPLETNKVELTRLQKIQKWWQQQQHCLSTFKSARIIHIKKDGLAKQSHFPYLQRKMRCYLHCHRSICPCTSSANPQVDTPLSHMNTSFSCVRKRYPSSKKLSNLLQFMSERLWQSFDSFFQITHRSLFLMLSSVLQQAKESALLCLRLHDW